MGHVPNLSTVPVLDCEPGVPCATVKGCYALRSAYIPYGKVRRAWSENSAYFRADPLAAAEELRRQLVEEFAKPGVFRFFVGGDFVSQGMVAAVWWLARQLPDTRFFITTKRQFDFGGKPDNIRLVISTWPGWENPHPDTSLPRSYVQDGTETRIPPGTHECQGHCPSCGRVCWSPEFTGDVWFHKH
jgi:hypothetical protein